LSPAHSATRLRAGDIACPVAGIHHRPKNRLLADVDRKEVSRVVKHL
jgi:hypothetical protein